MRILKIINGKKNRAESMGKRFEKQSGHEINWLEVKKKKVQLRSVFP